MSLDQALSESDSRRKNLSGSKARTKGSQPNPSAERPAETPFADHALNFLTRLNRTLAAQYQIKG